MDLTLTELLTEASLMAKRLEAQEPVQGSDILELIDSLRDIEHPEAVEAIRLLAHAALVRE